MEADYKRDMNHSYVVLKENGKQDMAAYQIRMLLGKGISSLLPCTVKGLNGELLFYYEITGKQPLSSFYEKQKIEGSDLRWILEGVTKGLQEMEEYLLDPADLILRPEYMYLDMEQKKIQFCYLPGYQNEAVGQFQRFTEYYLPKIDHRDALAVSMGYGVYRLAMEEELQADRIREVLYHPADSGAAAAAGKPEETQKTEEDFRKYQEQQEKEAARQEAMQAFFAEEPEEREPRLWTVLSAAGGAAVFLAALLALWYMGYLQWQVCLLLCAAAGIAAAGIAVWNLWRRKKTEEKTPEEPKTDPDVLWEAYQETCREEQEEKTSEGKAGREAEETVVLYQAEPSAVSSLVSKIPGKYPTIFLEQEMTVVGKLPVAADVILDSSTISRVHARITRKEDGFFLSDLNSRNGTCVNGRILQGEEEWELQNYDEVSFAEIQYVFIK